MAVTWLDIALAFAQSRQGYGDGSSETQIGGTSCVATAVDQEYLTGRVNENLPDLDEDEEENLENS